MAHPVEQKDRKTVRKKVTETYKQKSSIEGVHESKNGAKTGRERKM